MFNGLLKKAQATCRPLDIALIESCLKETPDSLLKHLQSFQNKDGGFGHGLEPDLMCPDSSVVATNVAVSILLDQEDTPTKQTMIESIINYYISVFESPSLSFLFAPKAVDDTPHAIWWDYDKLDQFPYGNPNLEVIGFLLQYQGLVKTRLPVNTPPLN